MHSQYFVDAFRQTLQNQQNVRKPLYGRSALEDWKQGFLQTHQRGAVRDLYERGGIGNLFGGWQPPSNQPRPQNPSPPPITFPTQPTPSTPNDQSKDEPLVSILPYPFPSQPRKREPEYRTLPYPFPFQPRIREPEYRTLPVPFPFQPRIREPLAFIPEYDFFQPRAEEPKGFMSFYNGRMVPNLETFFRHFLGLNRFYQQPRRNPFWEMLLSGDFFGF